jgi:hypothetical protein
MKKILSPTIVVIAFAVGVFFTTAFVTPQQNVASEEAEHPRIAKAITQMQDAIDYMNSAPHDFGGHKAAAIADTKAAIKSLKLAMAYRAKKDNK